MRITDHPLNQISVVGPRERLAFAESERTASAEVRDPPLHVASFVGVRQDQEVSEMVELGVLGFCAELGAAQGEARLEKRPAEGQEHQLGVPATERRHAISASHEFERLFDRQGLQLLADQCDPHVDLFDLRQTLEEVSKYRFLLHDPGPPPA